MHVLASSCPGDLRALPSFPTRRSSDLLKRRTPSSRYSQVASDSSTCASTSTRNISPPLFNDETIERTASASRYCTARRLSRSEEHTSELKSHVNLVCRLLLEKKKKHKI